MRLRILTLALICLSIAARAEALSFDVGPQLSLSRPTGRAHDAMDPGINVGAMATLMQDSTAGVGVDVGYHHWPRLAPTSCSAGGSAVSRSSRCSCR